MFSGTSSVDGSGAAGTLKLKLTLVIALLLSGALLQCCVPQACCANDCCANNLLAQDDALPNVGGAGAEPGNKQLEIEPPSGPLVVPHHTDGEIQPFDAEPLGTSIGEPVDSVITVPRTGIITRLMEQGPADTDDPAVLSRIEKSEFGIVVERDGASKNWQVHPVVVVPNMPGLQYMWKLKTNLKTPAFIREEFILPEAPSTWKVRSTSAQLIDGGSRCVLESFQPVDDGWVGHAWTVSPGDPPGKYEIKIHLNGKLARTFTFNVGDQKTESALSNRRDW